MQWPFLLIRLPGSGDIMLKIVASNEEPKAREKSDEPECYPCRVTYVAKDGTRSTRIEMFPMMTRPARVSMQGNKLIINMVDFDA